jgi:hypothetical protein
MQAALANLGGGNHPGRVDFATIRRILGFDEYDRLLESYAGPDRDESHWSRA